MKWTKISKIIFIWHLRCTQDSGSISFFDDRYHYRACMFKYMAYLSGLDFAVVIFVAWCRFARVLQYICHCGNV